MGWLQDTWNNLWGLNKQENKQPETKQQGAATAPSLQFGRGWLERELNSLNADDRQAAEARLQTTEQGQAYLKAQSMAQKKAQEQAQTQTKKAAEEKAEPWQLSTSPFASSDANSLYRSAIKELDASAGKNKDGLNPFKDAYDMVLAWENDIFAADSLYGGNKAGRNPFKVAGESYREKLEKRKLEYSINGKSDQELKALLEGSGYQSRSAIDEANQRAAIEYAEKYNHPEAGTPAAQAEMLGSLGDVAANAAKYGKGSLTEAQRAALEDALTGLYGQGVTLDNWLMNVMGKTMPDATRAQFAQWGQQQADALFRNYRPVDETTAYQHVADILNGLSTGDTPWNMLTREQQTAANQTAQTIYGQDAQTWAKYNPGGVNKAHLGEVQAFGKEQAQALWDKANRDYGAAPEMNYQRAEELLAKNEPLYDWAKRAGGELGGTAEAMSGLDGIVEKKLAGKTLTSEETRALDIAWEQMPELYRQMLNGKLDGAMKADVAQFAQEAAAKLGEYGGMFNQYSPTMPQQVYRDAWRKTPEGAAAWLEDETKGTPGWEEARANQWFVTIEDVDKGLQARADYNELAMPQEEYMKDPLYAVVNGKGTLDMRDDITDRRFMQARLLDEKDRALFNARVKEYGLENAHQYFDDYLSRKANEKNMNQVTQDMEAMGKDGFWGGAAASAVSVPLSLTRGIGALDILGQNLSNWWADLTGNTAGYRPIDRYSAANVLGTAADSARQGVQEQVDWNVNIGGRDVDVFDFLYGTAMSGVDSLAAGGLGRAIGGAGKAAEWISGAILGTGAAQSAVQDAYDRGASDGQALMVGTAAGIAETLFEKVSIGQFFKEADSLGRQGFRDYVKSMIKESFVNFTEEAATEIANIITEGAIMQDKGSMAERYAKYVRLGLSPDEARQRVNQDIAAQVSEAGLGGALMGGAFGLMGTAQANRGFNKMNRYSGSQIGQDTRNALWALAAMPEMQGTEAARIAKETSAQKANDKQVGELFRALSMGGTRSQVQSMGIENPSQTVGTGLYGQNPIGSAATEAMRKEFLIQMALRGGGLNETAADGLLNLMAGERLTEEQMNAVAADPAAMDIVNRVLAPNPDKATPRQDEARQLEQEQQAKDEEAPLDFEDVPGEPSPSPDGDTSPEVGGNPSQSADADSSPKGEPFGGAPKGEAFGAPSQPRQDAETPRQREAEQLQQEAERRAEETKQREAEAKAAQERLKEARDRIMAQEQAEREQAAAEAVKDQQAQAEARKAREAELRQLEEARNRLMAQEQEEREQAAAGAVADQQAQAEARQAREAELQRLEEARNRLMAQEQEEREQAAAKAVANQQAQAKAQKERAAELERLVAEDKAAQERLQEAKRLQQEARPSPSPDGDTSPKGEAFGETPKGEPFGAPTQPNPAKETPRQREAAQIPVKVKGEEKHVAGVRAQEDGSGIEVTTREGDTVDLDDIEAGDAEREVIRAAADMEDTDAQADMLASFDGGSDTQAAHDYAAGYKAVHDAAAKGTSYEDVKSIYGDTLTEDQRKAAHETGRRWGEALREKKRLRNIQAADEAGFEALQEGTGNRGGVFFADVDSGMKNEDGSIDKAKRVQLRVLNDFGQKNGIQYRVVDRGVDENAHYEVGTNVVYVALDAEGGALTRAASHETMHFIQEYAADMAQKIRDYVLERLKKVTGYDLEARIAEVMSQYTDHTGQPVTRAYAEEEIVADSLLDVIGTEEALSDLAKKTGSGSAIEKIGNWIKKTYAQLRELVNRYAKSSPEARALKDDVDYLEQVTGLFDQAVKTAKYAYQQSQQGLYQSEAQDSSVKEYVQDMQTATTEDARRSALDGLVNDLFTRIFGDDLMKQATMTGDMDAYETAFNEMLGQFRQALLDYKQQNIALSVALERNGLKGVPTGYNPALGYAAGQMVSQKAEAAVRSNLRHDVRDQEYMAAVNGGDMEKAQEMVDNAAKAAGYDIKAYHGTDYYKPITVFKKGKTGYLGPGIYLTSDERTAQGYADKSGYGGTVYSTYVRMNNPLLVTDLADPGREILEAAYGRKGMYEKRTNEQTNAAHLIKASDIKKLMDKGYDGILWKGGKSSIIEYMVFSPEQVKSADAMTYDSKGNVIPISQRFNEQNPDIRYSMRHDTQARQEAAATESVREDADLYAQVRQSEDARAALQLLTRLHETTTGGGENALIQKGAFEKRLTEMVRKAKEATGTDMSEQKIRKLLRAIYGAMEQEGYQVGEVLRFTRDAFKQMLEAAPGTFVEQDETTKEVIQALKDNRFRLTADQKSEINGTYGSLGDFMRKNFGRLKIRNNAKITLSEMWRETLTPLNPGLFPEDANPLEMPGIIDTFLDNAKKKVMMNGAAEYIDGTSTELALNAMLDFYDVPGALKTKAEIREGFRQQLEADDAVFAAYEEKFEEARALVQQYKQDARQAVRMAKEQLQKEAAEKPIVKDIRRNVRVLTNMVMKGTDQKHVPEDLRGLVEQLGRIMSGDRAVFSGEEAKNFLLRYERMGHDEQLHDPNLAALYDPDIADKLKWLSQRVAEKRLRQMTEEELKQISDVVQHIRFLVDNENQVEVAGRKQKVETLAGRLMDEMRKRGVASDNPIMRKLRAVMYKEMTPSYYGKQAGGVMEDLIRDVIKSQSGYAFTVQEGADRMAELVKKHHVNDWLHGENLRFTTKAGDEIELTKNQAMTLYAWWERETRNKLQSGNHLRLGGFTYDRTDKDTRAMKGVNVTGSHVIDAADMEQIRNYLTDEQRAFVADAVKYLSEDMAEKGNEMSMKLFGWKKFGEKWYFPYPTDRNFRGQNSTEAAGAAAERKLKNTGMTKQLTENASNPLKLGNFMDMWAAHVDEMARYSSMTEALENLARVTNWVVGQTAINDGSGNVQIIAPVSVKKEIENALGAEGVRYLEQFLRDANGGVTTDERGFSDKMISLFKKGSVAANMSVVLQQPSAFVRAMTMVSPKYFAKGVMEKGGFRATRERMYKNSGVALIKRMGRFDTNVGKTGTEYLLDSLKDESRLKRVTGFLDNITGIGAEKADEITWTYMYSAVEAEIEDRTDLTRGTAEFDKAVAERFDEVMNFTQVYDSTLAKSEWMRGTSVFDKMTTSFMAEPTVWVNVLMDAALGLKNKAPGAKGHALRAAAVFVAGSFVNAALQSLATAGRKKKDEGETIVEKYLGELSGNFTDSISLEGIAGMIPIARDVVSLLQGYDVERADMSVISDVVNALRKLQDKVKKGEATPEDWINLGNMALNGLGIPAKNVWRDLSGIYMNIGGWGFGGPTAAPIGTTSGRDIKYAILNNASPFSFFDLWDDSYAAYYQRMADALIAGDEKTYNELRGYMEETQGRSPEVINSGVNKALQNAWQEGKLGEEKDAIELIKKYMDMDDNDAYYQVRKWEQKNEWDQEEHEAGDKYSYDMYKDFKDAVRAGKGVQDLKKIIENHVAHGRKANSVGDSLYYAFADEYKELLAAGKKTEAIDLKAKIVNGYEASGRTRTKAISIVDGWVKEKKK